MTVICDAISVMQDLKDGDDDDSDDCECDVTFVWWIIIINMNLHCQNSRYIAN